MARMKTLEEILQQKMNKAAKREGMTLDEAMDKYGNPFGADPDTKKAPGEDEPNGATERDDNDPAQDDDRYTMQQNDDEADDPAQDDGPTDGGQSDRATAAEIAKLRNQLNAALGRIAPEQQRNAALESTLAQERQRNESKMQEMQRLLDEANAKIEEMQMKDFSVDDLLTEEEKESVDANMLEIIKKVSVAMAKHMAPKTDVKSVLEQELTKREQQRVNNYRNRILSGRNTPIANLSSLAQNDSFRAWVEDNVDVKYGLSAFFNGQTTDEIDAAVSALNKRIGDYYDQQKRSKARQTTGTDAVTTSLHNAMRRDSNKGQQLYKDFNRVNQRIKELSRSVYGRSKAGKEELNRLLKSLSDFK